MVARRKPKTVEQFAEEADKTPSEKTTEKKIHTMGISFSEDEYIALKTAAQSSKRSMKGFIRYAVAVAAEKELGQ